MKLRIDGRDIQARPGQSLLELVQATALDKKSDGDTLRLILLRDIGKTVIFPMTRDQLLAAL